MKLQINKLINVSRLEEEYPVLWETLKHELPHLDYSDIATIVEIITDICPHCYESMKPCHCWNDE